MQNPSPKLKIKPSHRLALSQLCDCGGNTGSRTHRGKARDRQGTWSCVSQARTYIVSRTHRRKQDQVVHDELAICCPISYIFSLISVQYFSLLIRTSSGKNNGYQNESARWNRRHPDTEGISSWLSTGRLDIWLLFPIDACLFKKNEMSKGTNVVRRILFL